MSTPETGFRHPLARARGLGSAKNGTEHWWSQRVSAVALALLTPWFLYLCLALAGADHGEARRLLGQPLNASLMLAFALALFWHAKLGLQVVVEDYVHTRWLEVSLQIAIGFLYALAAIVSAIAIGRVAFMP